VRVECPGCHKVYEIPDDRFKSNKKVTLPCPKCNTHIDIDPASSLNNPATPEDSKPDILSGEALKEKIVRSVGDLPPMPQAIFKAREILQDPNSSIKELAEVLESDPAIAAKVLQMANAPYYGMSGKVSSLQSASVVLGQKTIGELLTMAGASNVLGNTLEGYGLEAGFMWRHSLGVAFASRKIASMKHPSLTNDAFTAGLIHDVGKLVLDPYIVERKKTFESFMEDGQKTFLEAERAILGFSHSEIASELCKVWGVPASLAKAIQFHHDPALSNNDPLTYIIHTADALAMMTGLGLGVDGILYQLDQNAPLVLGLGEEETSEIMVETVVSVEDMMSEMKN
jgi:HD-like signal output (HDOD) protein